MNKTGENISGGQGARSISIWLDDYDDIFSDFDSRGYTDRVLSDDFIGEMSKVSHESESVVSELRLMMPEKMRNKNTESIIIKRLHIFFRKNFQQYASARKKTIAKGVLMLLSGIILVMSASYIGIYRQGRIGMSLLFTIMEPSGWFLIWSSFDDVFGTLKKKKPDLDFYGKMAGCKVTFLNIDMPKIIPGNDITHGRSA